MQDWLIVSLTALVAAILPEAALGASVGSLFYLLSTTSESVTRKVTLMAVGWVVGYSIGQALHGGGWSLLAAIMGSAFAVTIMLQISASLTTKETPTIVDWMIDAYIKVRK